MIYRIQVEWWYIGSMWNDVNEHDFLLFLLVGETHIVQNIPDIPVSRLDPPSK